MRYVHNGITWCLVIIKNREAKIDLLDEKELLEQLLQHYTLSCGITVLPGLEKLVIHTAT